MAASPKPDQEAAPSVPRAPHPARPIPHPLPRLAPVAKPVPASRWQAMRMHEKIQWYGARLTRMHARLADKLLAKDYVRRLRIPGLSVARLVRVLEGGPDDLRAEDLLPGNYVKAAHGCKWHIRGEAGLDLAACRERLRGWDRPFDNSAEVQVHYGWMAPRFFVEQEVPGRPVCFMVRCLWGRPISLSCISSASRLQNYYSPHGACLVRELPQSEVPDPPRELCCRLLLMAARMASPLEFVRVDFLVQGLSRSTPKVYFSEFTFTPSAGRACLPEAMDLAQGNMWPATVPRTAVYARIRWQSGR